MKYIFLLFIFFFISCNQRYDTQITHYLGIINTDNFNATVGFQVNEKNNIVNGYIRTGYPFPIEQIKINTKYTEFKCPFGVVGKAFPLSYKVIIENTDTILFKNAIIEISGILPPIKTKVELISSFTTNRRAGF